jgi:hypothetical protein
MNPPPPTFHRRLGAYRPCRQQLWRVTYGYSVSNSAVPLKIGASRSFLNYILYHIVFRVRFGTDRCGLRLKKKKQARNGREGYVRGCRRKKSTGGMPKVITYTHAQSWHSGVIAYRRLCLPLEQASTRSMARSHLVKMFPAVGEEIRRTVTTGVNI